MEDFRQRLNQRKSHGLRDAGVAQPGQRRRTERHEASSRGSCPVGVRDSERRNDRFRTKGFKSLPPHQ